MILGIKLYCRLQRPFPAQFQGDVLRKRHRKTAFSHEQLYRLEESFEQDRFPGIQIREELARELNIGEDRIHVSCLGKVINMSFQWVSEQKDKDFEKTTDT